MRRRSSETPKRSDTTMQPGWGPEPSGRATMPRSSPPEGSGIWMSVAARTVADATVAVVGPEVDITALVAGGLGLGRLTDGRVALVEGALPGDRVEVAVTED